MLDLVIIVPKFFKLVSLLIRALMRFVSLDILRWDHLLVLVRDDSVIRRESLDRFNIFFDISS